MEFKVTKYKLSKKTAPIPQDLLGLEDDPTIQDRWKNAFRMFDGTDKIKVEIPLRDESGRQMMNSQGDPKTILYGEEALEADRRKIEKDFFFKVHGYGVVIFRARRTAFDERIQSFEQRVQDYKKAVQEKVRKSIDDTINRLAEVLLPLIREKPPARYLKSASTNKIPDSELARLLEEDLRKSFGAPDKIASPEIKLQYKDIAYETIHEDRFHEELARAGIPKSRLEQLFSEHDAAPEALRDNRNIL